MKRKLYLFTDTFPFDYENKDQFIKSEVDVLSQVFDLTLIPLFYAQGSKYNGANFQTFAPILNDRSFTTSIKSALYFGGNFISLLRRVSSLKQFKALMKQIIIVRSIQNRKDILQILKSSHIKYFFWGTNSINATPFTETNGSIITRFHGFDLYEEDRRANNFLFYRSEIFKKIDLCLPISLDGFQYLTSKYHPRLITINRLGTPNKGINSLHGDFSILTCSYLKPVKRIHLVVDILKHIDFDMIWYHIGGGSANEVEALLKNASLLPKNVTLRFLGNFTPDQVSEFYLNTHVSLFCNVSESEGVPVSIMEALSFGIPILATDVGGTREILEESYSILVDKNFNPEAVALKIREFRDSDQQNSRESARNGWKKYCSQSENLNLLLEHLSQL